jgi:basic membrane lipoprotein Med (substrate-binding protein (PBP1-ABC) superfamily)
MYFIYTNLYGIIMCKLKNIFRVIKEMNKQNKKSPGYALIGLLVGFLIGAIFSSIAGDETGTLAVICIIIGGWVGYNGFTESSILITQKAKQSSRNVKENCKRSRQKSWCKKGN